LYVFYVDDLLITKCNESHTSDFKNDMMREFEIIDLSHLSYFLGIVLQRRGEGLLMNQRRHASEILKGFEMEHYNSEVTPAEPRLQLSKDANEKEVDPNQYKRLIGSLRYLCNMRPDLAYIVGIVSRFMEKSKSSHLEATKRILRYIRSQKSNCTWKK